MAGRKDLVLYKGSQRAGNRYCYKSLKSAVRRAMDLSMETRKSITIYDETKGQDLAVVGSSRLDIGVTIVSPRLFNQRWQ